MIKLLVKTFVTDSENIEDTRVRQRYGILAGFVGIILNITLFMLKMISALITGSVSIIADALNNLSDAGSSIVTLIGFKAAGKPADNDHPFGHARAEYLSGLIVSLVIILMGFELFKTSVSKIISSETAEFTWFSIAVLITSILVKLWMAYFNKKLGKLIDSSVMRAAALDSLSDVCATSAVFLTSIIGKFTDLNLDGYAGVLVSLFITYTGFTSIKDSLDPLLGQAPDKELVEKIEKTVLKYDGIIGIHELIVHNYGPNCLMISLHAEVSCDMDIMAAHDVVDRVELELEKQFNCHATIHIDPIAMDDEETILLKNKVCLVVSAIDEKLSIHDFRIKKRTDDVIDLIFDVVVPFRFRLSDDEIRCAISKAVRAISENYFAIVEIDRDFSK